MDVIDNNKKNFKLFESQLGYSFLVMIILLYTYIPLFFPYSLIRIPAYFCIMYIGHYHANQVGGKKINTVFLLHLLAMCFDVLPVLGMIPFVPTFLNCLAVVVNKK